MEDVHGWAITIDQRRSRTTGDAVPRLLAGLAELPVLDLRPDGTVCGGARPPRWDLVPERTAGDEVQAFTTDPATLVAAVWSVCGEGRWWCGVGLGEVAAPLPGSTREASGSAYIAAREAIGDAKSNPRGLVVRTSLTVPAPPRGASGPDPALRFARVMDVLAGLAGATTSAVLEVCALYDRGMTRSQAARRLGISPPAVSQRLTGQGWAFLRETRALAVDLAASALDLLSPAATRVPSPADPRVPSPTDPPVVPSKAAAAAPPSGRGRQ